MQAFSHTCAISILAMNRSGDMHGWFSDISGNCMGVEQLQICQQKIYKLKCAICLLEMRIFPLAMSHHGYCMARSRGAQVTKQQELHLKNSGFEWNAWNLGRIISVASNVDTDENPRAKISRVLMFSLSTCRLSGVWTMMTPMLSWTEGCGFRKTWCSCPSSSSIDAHGFSKKFAVLKDREEWELKIFVSQLKISCEYYHLSGKQWRRLCVWAACLFRTNLRGRLFLMQSVEHGTRCGGYSHILVKAVKRVTVSSYVRDGSRGNWGKMRIGPT